MKTRPLAVMVVAAFISMASAELIEVGSKPEDRTRSANTDFTIVLAEGLPDGPGIAVSVAAKKSLGSFENAVLVTQTNTGERLSEALLEPLEVPIEGSLTFLCGLSPKVQKKSYLDLRFRKEGRIATYRVILGSFKITEEEPNPE